MSDLTPVRIWYVVHKWTSLVCTAFLLILCLSGLPLIFTDEISEWSKKTVHRMDRLPGEAAATLDQQTAVALHSHPGEAVRWIVFDKDGNPVITLTPSLSASPEKNHWIKFASGSIQITDRSSALERDSPSFMKLALKLHTDLFAGLPGELFLAAMGLLFLVAIASGLVLYGHFMRKLEFGTVRAARARRLRWLDLHNLLGIVTLTWACVVGVTGVVNELSTPLFGLWRTTELTSMLAPHQRKPMLQQTAPVQLAVDTATQTLPENTIFSIVFPDAGAGIPRHYLVWTKGGSALTSRLFTPLLIDAQTAELTAIAYLPWYLKALEISRPLHFGDYGGLPLKIIWALLDLLTMVVLGSGLYLWFARRKATEARIEKLVQSTRAAP